MSKTSGAGASLERPNNCLDPDVAKRVQDLSRERCLEWGGEWGEPPQVTPSASPVYQNRTVVRDAEGAMEAFEKYTTWFEYVLETYTPTADNCILLPCGSSKPIGSSSIHQKKLEALSQAGLRDEADVVILSEPCTVVPHEQRLHLAPVNYDFPPDFTEPEVAPEVAELFASRLAEFMDEMGYETYYPYLVKGHQETFDRALELAEQSPGVVVIPGASFGLESHNYSGDLFKTVEDVTAKIDACLALKSPHHDTDLSDYDEEVRSFYAERPEYQN